MTRNIREGQRETRINRKEVNGRRTNQVKKKTILETIKEEEKIEQENLGIREWTNKNNKMGNIVDPYYEL